MEARERTILYYIAPNGGRPFREWRQSLTDKPTKAAVDARIAGLNKGNFGDHRSVGKGAIESRIDFGPGYRIYFAVNGDDLILLHGGDKSSQGRDIEIAKSRWDDYKKRTRDAQHTKRLQNGSSRRSKK